MPRRQGTASVPRRLPPMRAARGILSRQSSGWPFSGRAYNGRCQVAERQELSHSAFLGLFRFGWDEGVAAFQSSDKLGL